MADATPGPHHRTRDAPTPARSAATERPRRSHCPAAQRHPRSSRTAPSKRRPSLENHRAMLALPPRRPYASDRRDSDDARQDSATLPNRNDTRHTTQAGVGIRITNCSRIIAAASQPTATPTTTNKKTGCEWHPVSPCSLPRSSTLYFLPSTFSYSPTPASRSCAIDCRGSASMASQAGTHSRVRPAPAVSCAGSAPSDGRIWQ